VRVTHAGVESPTSILSIGFSGKKKMRTCMDLPKKSKKKKNGEHKLDGTRNGE